MQCPILTIRTWVLCWLCRQSCANLERSTGSPLQLYPLPVIEDTNESCNDKFGSRCPNPLETVGIRGCMRLSYAYIIDVLPWTDWITTTCRLDLHECHDARRVDAPVKHVSSLYWWYFTVICTTVIRSQEAYWTIPYTVYWSTPPTTGRLIQVQIGFVQSSHPQQNVDAKLV